MARELRRLLIAPERLAAAAEGVSLELEPPEAHYLGRVLRTRPGDRVAVVDGCGGLWTARLLEPARLSLEQPVARPLQRQSAPRPRLSLALAVPKREPELVWRMATELGVDHLQPLQAERCVLAGRWPLPRWRTIIAEAVEQCERLWLPQLAEPMPATAWLAAAPLSGATLSGATLSGAPLSEATLSGATPCNPTASAGGGGVAVTAADPAAGSGAPVGAAQLAEPGRMGPGGGAAASSAMGGDRRDATGWREPPASAHFPGFVGLLATTRRSGLPLLAATLLELAPAADQELCLAIGPEGGWSPTEEEAALSAGWRPVSLGPTILRSSTAALAGLADLVSWRNLSSPSFPAPSP